MNGLYGSVRVFHPTWTEPDPDNPGKRRTREALTWNYRFYWRGQRYTGGEKYETKTAAKEAGEKRKALLRAGVEDDPRKANFTLIDRILTSEAELQTPVTAASHRAILKRLRAFFAHDLLRDITRERLIEYVAHQRAEAYQDSTTKLDLRHLKTGMNLAYERGALSAVPRFPKLPVTRRQETVQPHELDMILSHLGEEWIRYYLIADELGWRAQSEIKSRRWTDVDFSVPGWVHLDAAHSKTKVARAYPMTVRLRGLLESQKAWVEKVASETGRIIPWVFCRSDGEPLGDPRKAWRAACAAAGFGKLEGRTGPWSSAKVPHDIRRTVIRRWQESGERMDLCMALVGHSTVPVHAGYSGAEPKSLVAFAERQDEKRKEQAEKVTAIRKSG